MKQHRRTAILMIGGCLSFVVGHVGMASAQTDANPDGSGPSCVITGDAYVTKDTAIYQEVSGGSAVAQFSGARAPLKATRFPKDASQGRVLVNTGGGFRVEGFTDPRAMTVFGNRDLAAVPGHVWISAATPLKFAGAAPGRVEVELPAMAGLSRPIRAKVTCDAVTFDQGTPPLYEVPKRARGYVAKQGTLDLYGSAGGDVVHTLYVSGEGNGLLLWGTTVRNGFVHVTMRSSIYVDAWVKLRDVRALPRGELMDQLVPPARVQSPPKLALQDFMREMKAPKQMNLHYGRGVATPIIGALEQDAEIYVIETVVGWATVLPKGLHVMPHGDRAFWVRASDLGLESPDAGAP